MTTEEKVNGVIAKLSDVQERIRGRLEGWCTDYDQTYKIHRFIERVQHWKDMIVECNYTNKRDYFNMRFDLQKDFIDFYCSVIALIAPDYYQELRPLCVEEW